jgi:Ca-activated chloride channel family protein
MRFPRPVKNSLLLLPLFFAAQKICAQPATADDFFNSGAQFYISNNIPAALEKTEGGLKFYPDDVKLKKLEELLKQKQQQQNQQNQKQQSQSQQDSNGQKNQQQKNQNGQKQPEQQKPDGEKKENQNGENQTASGQMTPEEAKRLLDAQKGDEQVLQLKPQGKPENPNQPVKDW